ncbi:MAG: aminotransferase class IV [Proteobacteria bacterium]|nr:aminotransferase class IV [Pseudomonadota bacterium]
MSLVYLNGEFKALKDASINVLDRGFTFGDGVYEVIPAFNKTIFRLEEHIQRLERSLAAIYMDNPLSQNEWSSIFTKLIESTDHTEQSIYLQITRGITARDHDISLAEEPTVFIMSRPIEKNSYSEGIKAITHEDIRWQYCNVKAITLLPSVLLRHRAKLQGATEAILIRDGIVTEGAASNIFICVDGQVVTPIKDNRVLPGITRDLILEIMVDNNIKCVESSIDSRLLNSADEIWLTSSTWEIVPVIELDDKKVGTGKPGPVWQKINRLYQDFKRDYCN